MYLPMRAATLLLWLAMSCISGQILAQVPAWALLPFVKVDSVNPILQPRWSPAWRDPISGQEVHWMSHNVLNPAAVVKDGKLYLLFRAQDSSAQAPSGTSRIGLAYSSDGLHFHIHSTPVLYPAHDALLRYEWPGGIEDPRVVKREDGLYVMTYTAYDGHTARLCIASSRDLLHWTKHGLAFPDTPNLWSKSGAIISTYREGGPVAQKIQGKYWMYWGDTHIFLASSSDLIHWYIVRDSSGHLLSVLAPRPHHFDSRLVESGPPPIWTTHGILLIYNGMNAADSLRDPAWPPDMYGVGQAWIDPLHPQRVLHRLTSPFLIPEKTYELHGQVNRVCFAEGLVRLAGKWFLYYGTADSRVAVAVHQP